MVECARPMVVLVFSGKGGTGKTSLATLCLKHFVDRAEVTLALDLDPDAHLHKPLGIPVRKTVGELVDRVHKEKRLELEPRKPVDTSDQEYFSSLVMQEVLVEGNSYDLLTLGKPSSEVDCYCPVFLWAQYAIARVLGSYGTTYRNIVVDCDPGTEILPRRVLDQIAERSGIDILFLVLDASLMSLDTAKAIVEEVKKRRLKVGNMLGVCNRVDDHDTRRLLRDAAADRYDISVVGNIPTDPVIHRASLANQSLLNTRSYPAYEAMKEILSSLGA